MAKVISSLSAKKVQLQTMPDTNQAALSTFQHAAQDESRLGGYAYQVICKQSQTIAALRSPVLADKDSEDLHQMRIATRRLTAAVILFQDAISMVSKKGKPQSTEKLIKSIREITKVLGGVRDMDVMQRWFLSVLENDTDNRFSKQEKKTIRALLKTIKKRRKKRFAKLVSFLEGDRYQKTMRRFKRWIKQPSFTEFAQSDISVAAAEKVVEPIAKLLQHPAWRMASCSVSDRSDSQLEPISSLTLAQLNQQLAEGGQQLHDLRKQIKNVRYQTEFFRGLYGITYASQVREFRTLQKILGGLQDQIVVSQFLTDEIGENWAQKLPTIAADFQNSRLSLWQQWQPYQQKYLKLSR